MPRKRPTPGDFASSTPPGTSRAGTTATGRGLVTPVGDVHQMLLRPNTSEERARAAGSVAVLAARHGAGTLGRDEVAEQLGLTRDDFAAVRALDPAWGRAAR